jgi:hypothetical protein
MGEKCKLCIEGNRVLHSRWLDLFGHVNNRDKEARDDCEDIGIIADYQLPCLSTDDREKLKSMARHVKENVLSERWDEAIFSTGGITRFVNELPEKVSNFCQLERED